MVRGARANVQEMERIWRTAPKRWCSARGWVRLLGDETGDDGLRSGEEENIFYSLKNRRMRLERRYRYRGRIRSTGELRRHSLLSLVSSARKDVMPTV